MERNRTTLTVDAATRGAPTVLSDIATETSRYLNRELSWLAFNGRVLEEALDERQPLLERVKFLAIVGTNLDEFFLIRVAGIKQQVAAGVAARSPDGMTPAEQLVAIRQVVECHIARQRACWLADLQPRLRAQGISVLDYGELNEQQRAFCTAYFEREVFPVLTPLAFDPHHPFPHISNLRINLAVVISDPEEGELFARQGAGRAAAPDRARRWTVRCATGDHRREDALLRLARPGDRRECRCTLSGYGCGRSL